MNVIGVNKEGTCPFKGTSQSLVALQLVFLHKMKLYTQLYIFEEYNERGSGSVNLLSRIYKNSCQNGLIAIFQVF